MGCLYEKRDGTFAGTGRFLSPRWESTPQPSGLRSDPLAIELPGVRWQSKGYDKYWFICATYYYAKTGTCCIPQLILHVNSDTQTKNIQATTFRLNLTFHQNTYAT